MERRHFLRYGAGVGIGVIIANAIPLIVRRQALIWAQALPGKDLSIETAVANARSWLINQISNGSLGSPLLTDWGAKGLVAAAHVTGLPPPGLTICDQASCLLPAADNDDLVRSVSRTVLTRLALGLPVPTAFVDLLTDKLWADLGNPLTSTKAFGIMALERHQATTGTDHQSLITALRNRLLELRNADGGWPIAFNGTTSSVTDVTSSIRLLGLGDNGWLSSRQNPDGGFNFGPSTPSELLGSTVDSTSWAFLIDPGNSQAQDFLLACQDPDGHFKKTPTDDPGTLENQILRTSYALIALAGGYPVTPWNDPTGVGNPLTEPGLSLTCQPSLFRTTTKLVIRSNRPTNGTLRIVNVVGQNVATWPITAANVTSLTWNGRDNSGRLVPTGRYFLRLETATGTATCNVVFAR